MEGRPSVIVDDMINTGTIEEAVRVLLARAASDITVAADHGLFVGTRADRLRDLPIHRLLIPGTLDQEPMPALP